MILSEIKSISIRTYRKEDYHLWNTFVTEAKNATFLFHRDFMEYHQNIFEDFSLMIFSEKKLIGIFPAHRIDDKFYSHWGLTYGGLVTKENFRTQIFINIFENIISFLKDNGFRKLFWKEIPHFYTQAGNDEWKYLMYVLNAKLTKRHITSVINLRKEFKVSSMIKRHIKNAKKFDFQILELKNYTVFWNEVLVPELLHHHQTAPVHTYKEIETLADKFPENIKGYAVFLNEKIIAGTVLFINKDVVHTQYISGLRAYRETGALDLLFYHLITNIFKDYTYFDFGISNETRNEKTQINSGLLFWKESFGARSIAQDFYELDFTHLLPFKQIYI